MDREEALKWIGERHSVRTYKHVPVEAEKLDRIRSEIERMNASSGLRMQLIEGAEGVYTGIMSKMWGWKNIPAYIAFVGKDEPSLDEACGYYGEELAILMQSMGLNTCWAGMFKKKAVKADIAEGERLCLTLAFGYGEDQGVPHKSKSFSDVCRTADVPDWFRAGVECALLAPTAINQQKFVFSYADDKVVLEADGKGPFIMVDLGIVKYHFEIGSGHKLE